RRIEELLEKLKEGPPPPGEIRQTLRAGERCIETMAFTRRAGSASRAGSVSDGDEFLAAADRDGIRFWDPKTGKDLPRVACPHGAPKGSPWVSTAGPCLALGAAVRKTQGEAEPRGESATPKQAETEGHVGEAGGIAFPADGRTLASSPVGEPVVRLWDTSTGR